jgi:RHH-type proline utilization regulon transcriptional repressor/proline dehydrogenase/delta 1-pyrroline-5-carboxylate dehydrogenase
MLQAPLEIYSQFATHNAYTIATILDLTKEYQANFEWQRLQGMGDALYALVLAEKIPCRIYAPVGKHEVLLPYLARRLLENGANSSFVHQIADNNIPVEKIIADPLAEIAKAQPQRNPLIPLPLDIYGTERLAAKGLDLSDRAVYAWLNAEMQKHIPNNEKINSLIAAKTQEKKNTQFSISSPANTKHIIAHGVEASANDVEKAIEAARDAWPKWAMTPVDERAKYLLHAADLLEQRMPEFMTLAIYEAGKTPANAIGEVREAIDYCRYYATQAIRLFAEPKQLPGPTGESNILLETGRGLIVCISPWNFPLAIFLGQVTASLVAGNVVIAKPAEQTPLIAYKAVQLFYEAGIPKDVLQLVLGTGETVGATLVGSPHVAGVVFTGSVPTAQLINRSLANKSGPITPLIAETGGVNAMVVDSTALLEQVARDVLSSAFDSAGQRCSALRVLLIQEEIAEPLIKLLRGSMQELQIGDPSLLKTDIGPVIDNDALQMLQEQQLQLEKKGQLIYQMNIPTEVRNQGRFFAPCAYELKSIDDINMEIFGPVLVIIRYKTEELSTVLDKLQAKRFGLTFGIQTRLSQQAQMIAEKMAMGNIYINRNMIGAVVGCQPFGGQGLSGTGPKAGGPHYLQRLTTEKVISVNTAAIGGNVALMGME